MNAYIFNNEFTSGEVVVIGAQRNRDAIHAVQRYIRKKDAVRRYGTVFG